MKTVKAWNLTDSPKVSGDPSVIELFGQRVAPGDYALVPEDRVGAKVRRLVNAGILFIGDAPSVDYVLSKKQPGHGRLPMIAKALPKPRRPEPPSKKAAPATAPEPKKLVEENSGETPCSSEFLYSSEFLESCRKDELVALCGQHDLPTYGFKADLVMRLAVLRR